MPARSVLCCIPPAGLQQGNHASCRGDAVFFLVLAGRMRASQLRRLLVRRLLNNVLYNLFHEQWYGSGGAQKPGMAAVQRLLEQVNPAAACGPVSRPNCNTLAVAAPFLGAAHRAAGHSRAGSVRCDPRLMISHLLATQHGCSLQPGLTWPRPQLLSVVLSAAGDGRFWTATSSSPSQLRWASSCAAVHRSRRLQRARARSPCTLLHRLPVSSMR